MSDPVPKVCVGILARNEAERIGCLVQDLARQTLLTDDRLSIRIIVVANGCTDETAEAARRSLAKIPLQSSSVTSEVYELSRPGKSNAWNELVHHFVPADTDYLFLLDGDIRIPSPDSMSLVLRRLSSSNAVVAVDRSLKDIEFEYPSGVVENLIKLATGTANDPHTAIAGAFYCVRYAEVQEIWMPVGLPGEDGFLRAMLLTSSFAHPERLDRHIFVEGAYHVFESVRDVKGVLRHNVRLAIGTAVNILLFGHLREVRNRGQDISAYIRQKNDEDPYWINALIRARLQISYFPLETKFVFRRLRRLRGSDGHRPIKSWLIGLLGTAFDFVVFLRATALMRRGAGAGYW